MSPGPILASQLIWPDDARRHRCSSPGSVWGIDPVAPGARRLALLALVAALLSLAPVLVLKDRFVPYLAYLAEAAGALALVPCCPRAGPRGFRSWCVLAIAGRPSGASPACRIRLANRNELGLVADPVVRATSLSWQACRTLPRPATEPGAANRTRT